MRALRWTALVCNLALGLPSEATVCPTLPPLVSSISAPAGMIARAGDTVLIASGSQLQVFSFADPAAPVHAQSIQLPASITSISAAGTHAYVGLADDRTGAIDIADPFASSVLGWTQTACDRILFALDDGCIQLCRQTGITSFHLSEAGELNPVSSLPSASNTHSVAQIADRIYVSDRTHQLKVFQLGPGSSLGALPSVPLPDAGGALASHADELYVLLEISFNKHELATYDLSEPDSQRLVQRLPTVDRRNPVWIAGNVYLESEVFVPLASGEGFQPTIRMIDRRRRDLLEFDGMMLGNLAAGGLELRQPAPTYEPQSAYDLQLAGNLYELVELDGRAFVAAGVNGVHVIDAGAQPNWIGTIATAGSSVDVAVREGLLAVADYDTGLRFFDPSDLSSPLASVQFATPVRCVALIADLAYVGVDDVGVVILDMSSATSPIEIFRLPMSGPISDLEINGNRAAVSAQGQGIRILDLTDPGQPSVAHELLGSGRPVQLALSSDLLAIAFGYYGMAVFEFSEDGTPQFLPTPSFGQSQGVCIAGDLVYVMSESFLVSPSELQVYHRDELSRGRGFVWTTGELLGLNVRVLGDRICYLGSTGMLRILDQPCLDEVAPPAAVVSQPEPVLRAVFPNPSATSVQIELSPTLAGPFDLRCYDVRGRLVWQKSLAQVPGNVRWDGRDQSGQPVAAGVYHLRVRAGGRSQNQRIVLLGEGLR